LVLLPTIFHDARMSKYFSECVGIWWKWNKLSGGSELEGYHRVRFGIED